MNQEPSDKDKKRFQQAMDALNSGRSKEAIRLFEKVQKTGNNHPDIWYLLGLAYGKLGKMAKVRQVSLRCLDVAPNHSGALCNLANALLVFGEPEGALENYGKAMKAKPGDETIINNYGRALDTLGRRDEAIEHFKGILERNKSYAPAYASLGKAYVAGGYPEKAIKKFNEALSLDSRLMDAHVGIGLLHTGMGGLALAQRHLQAAIDIEPKNLEARIGLVAISNFLGHHEQSFVRLEEAAQYYPNSIEVLARRADLLERTGDYDEAYKIIQRLNKNNQVTAITLSVQSHLCRRFDTCDEVVKLIERSQKEPRFNIGQKQSMSFDMGRLLDKQKHYDEAFEHYKKANETVEVESKLEKDTNHVDSLINFFTKKTISSLPRADIATKRPIFILGMPRSGTSLTEQILAGHPDVYGAGELGDLSFVTNQIRGGGSTQTFYDYVEALSGCTKDDVNKYAQMYLDRIAKLNPDAPHVTDKMPHNFLRVGVISLLFPEAKIIHCKRNPLDNGLSIYFQHFSWTHHYAMDLERIGQFYNLYDRLMKHWEKVVDIPMMTCQYEDMVEDKAAMSKQLIEFCDLEWDEKILDFHKSDRAIATASYDQVRQPMYKTSRERWKNYEKHIGPLMDALDVKY